MEWIMVSFTGNCQTICYATRKEGDSGKLIAEYEYKTPFLLLFVPFSSNGLISQKHFCTSADSVSIILCYFHVYPICEQTTAKTLRWENSSEMCLKECPVILVHLVQQRSIARKPTLYTAAFTLALFRMYLAQLQCCQVRNSIPCGARGVNKLLTTVNQIA